MKIDATIIVGVTFAVLAIIIFSSVAIQNTFPIFSSENQNGNFVDVNQNVGSEDSRFMWDNYGLALIAQAVALFAAAAATLGLSKIDEEKP